MFLFVHTYVTMSLTNGPIPKPSSLSLSIHLGSRFGRRRRRRKAFLSSSSSSGSPSLMDYAHQKVHPLDVESSTTMNSGAPYPPKYVMLSENSGSLRPPPYRRNIPRYHSTNSKSGGSGCLRCICCCYCFLFILIFVLAGLAFYFYTMFQPKMPSYKVDHLDIGAFNVQMDFSLYTEFVVTVKAENPNDHIGFIYGKESLVIVAYTGSTLCSGNLPAFHQGHKNTTMMKVVLKGKSEFGSGLQQALMENRHTGRIPLLISVKAPVSVVLGEFPLRQFTVLVNCSLVVDNLSPNKKVGILSSKYDVGVAF